MNISKWIIKKTIPESYLRNEVDAKNITFFVSSWFVTFICTVLYLVVLYFIKYWIGVYVLLYFMLWHITFLVMLRKHAPLLLIGNLFAGNSLIGFLLFIITSGGVSSPVVAWIICTQVTAFWYANKKSGIIWSVISIVSVFTLFMAESFGVKFPLMFPERYYPVFSGIMHTGVLVYYLIVIITYEGWTTTAINAVNKKKDELQKQHLELLLLNQHLNESNDNLEAAIREIGIEKQKSEELLLNILPSSVADELKEKGKAEAHRFDHVSILFTDFVNFTGTAEKLTPEELVKELHECFTAFDNIMVKNGLEKIKTVGDAYLAVCGLPDAVSDHAGRAVRAATQIQKFMNDRSLRKSTFDIRIGIHSGSVVAGIVGIKKFAYDIWGDTVNTASRMEQNSEPGKINISETTYQLVKDDFNCAYRGEIAAKNKGKLKMYFVEKATA